MCNYGTAHVALNDKRQTHMPPNRNAVNGKRLQPKRTRRQ